MSIDAIQAKKQINRIALWTGVSNLLLVVFLLFGLPIFESPENEMHRLSGSGGPVLIAAFLAIIIALPSLAHVVLALTVRKKVAPKPGGISGFDAVLVTFSIGLFIVVILLTRAVAGMA
ncbi:MAG: hypothetical protein EBS85_05795 [Micrococcales bacterium]|nr:hypothetical protein [Actinomycetota bacterium]NCA08220.1 hypothetical protein [Micrococcales bacterium]